MDVLSELYRYQGGHWHDANSVGNAVDHSTGTIVARATIANSDLSILPGQYVHVRISLGEIPDALMVPQTAIGSNQLGKYLYVVGREDKVEQRLVSLGPTNGDLVAVLTGISEGESVICGNLQQSAEDRAGRTRETGKRRHDRCPPIESLATRLSRRAGGGWRRPLLPTGRHEDNGTRKRRRSRLR
jgi:hypothetical protein